jgi:Spy/CpxP family protein refolding chaperone
MSQRLGIAVAAAFVASAAAGCGGGNVSSAPTVTAGGVLDDDATADLTEHHRYHHHGGVTLFIAMSLDSLGVSPEQRAAVEKIRIDLHAKMEPARAAEQSLVAALADGLAVGNIDTAKVDAAVAQVTSAAAQVHDASADALNQLHAQLSPVQRGALVDKVEAHWATWQRANASEAGPGADGRHLALLAKELGLSTDQTSRIRARLDEGAKTAPRFDAQEIAAHLRNFGDAFRSEQFDAKAITTAGSAHAHLVGFGAAHLARFVEAVSPELTPDQRTALAQRLREHAAHNPSAEASK